MKTNKDKDTTFSINPLSAREEYKAPVMEIVEVNVEQGFQMSAPPSNDPLKEKYF